MKRHNQSLPGMGGVFNTVNVSLYRYVGNNPVKYTDSDGNFVETAWDVFSLIAGAASFVADVKAGNVKGAVIDGLGIVADAAAVVLPCIPGGASAAIKAARLTGASANLVGGLLSVQDGLEKGDYVEAGLGVVQATSGVGQLSKTLSSISKANIPNNVSNALTHIRNGENVPGGNGGSIFKNKGGFSRAGSPNQVLPKVDANRNPITYKEWDVNPKISGQPRDGERIVTGSDGSIWWTKNHYETFTQLE